MSGQYTNMQEEINICQLIYNLYEMIKGRTND